MILSESPLLRWVDHWQTQGVSLVPALFRLHQVDCVPSTNSYLWERLNRGSDDSTYDSGQQDSIVAIARRQSRGRGQWGRQWTSPSGGLYLSASLPALSVNQAGPLMLSCAWGVAVALRQFGVPVQLKWPNDLVIGSRKLGGMLIETRLSGAKITQAVLGIGINWRNEVPPGGISIAELNSPDINPQIQASSYTVTAAVLTGIAVGYGRLQSQGVESILPDYETLMTHRGQTIAINNQGRQKTGRVVGVAPTGQLRLSLDRAAPSTSLAPVHSKPVGLPSEIVADPGSIHLCYDAIEH
ncbi:MAG: biotin--[acetyl-CoA-carboxylase] ligase [Elainellaceae cyanobacterium]